MKNIAVVTLGYYPKMSPVTAVLDKYIQLMKGDYHFHIIALQSQSQYEPLDDPHISVYDMTSYWWRLRMKFEEKYKKSPSLINKTMIQLLRIRGALEGIIGDYRQMRWIETCAYSTLINISKSVNLDAVISVSGPYLFMHKGAMKYKEKYPETKWLTFITDPISLASSQFKLIKINEKKRVEKLFKEEKKVYEAANFNIFTENLYYDAIEKFNQPKEKSFQFRFTLENMQALSPKEQRRQDQPIIKLIYAGTLYRQIRNPEYMLSVLSKVPNIKLDMYVRTMQCMDILEKYKSDKIKIHDGVDTNRYKEMICNEYDILINIGNNCENQLPSKTLELLSSGRPIINFYYFKDSQYEMIKKYPLGLNIGREEPDALKKVDSFCNKMRGRQLSFFDVEKLFPENSIERQKTILELLINK